MHFKRTKLKQVSNRYALSISMSNIAYIIGIEYKIYKYNDKTLSLSSNIDYTMFIIALNTKKTFFYRLC